MWILSSIYLIIFFNVIFMLFEMQVYKHDFQLLYQFCKLYQIALVVLKYLNAYWLHSRVRKNW